VHATFVHEGDKNTAGVKYRTLVSAVALNLLNGTGNSAIVQNARD